MSGDDQLDVEPADAGRAPPAAPETDAAEGFLADVAAACKARKPFTLRLEVPIVFGRETIDELTFHRPTAAVLDQWQLGERRIGAHLDLAARLCKRDPAVLKKLDIDDVNKVVIVAGFFSGQGLPTGGL